MECNLIWHQALKTARVRLKSQVDKYDFRPKLHNTKFNYYFITIILKSQNSVRYQYFIDQVTCLLQKAETKSSLHLILNLKEKWCDLDKNGAIPKQRWCDLEREWCNLKQMWFGEKKCDSWISRTAESQSDWRDHQWFQNGYNK